MSFSPQLKNYFKNKQILVKNIIFYRLPVFFSGMRLPKEYAGSMRLVTSCSCCPMVDGRRYRPGPGPWWKSYKDLDLAGFKTHMAIGLLKRQAHL